MGLNKAFDREVRQDSITEQKFYNQIFNSPQVPFAKKHEESRKYIQNEIQNVKNRKASFFLPNIHPKGIEPFKDNQNNKFNSFLSPQVIKYAPINRNLSNNSTLEKINERKTNKNQIQQDESQDQILQKQHPSLKTTILTVKTDPTQIMHDTSQPSFFKVDKLKQQSFNQASSAAFTMITIDNENIMQSHQNQDQQVNLLNLSFSNIQEQFLSNNASPSFSQLHYQSRSNLQSIQLNDQMFNKINNDIITQNIHRNLQNDKNQKVENLAELIQNLDNKIIQSKNSKINTKQKKNYFIHDTINLHKIKNFRDDEIKNMLIEKIEMYKPKPEQIIEQNTQKAISEKKSEIIVQDSEIDWKYVTGQMIMQAFQEKLREDKIQSLKTKSEVYTNVYDNQTQEQIMEIVKQRLQNKKKKIQQFKVLSGQICGIDGRISKQSDFISLQLKHGLVQSKKVKDLQNQDSLLNSPLFKYNTKSDDNKDIFLQAKHSFSQTDKFNKKAITIEKQKTDFSIKKQVNFDNDQQNLKLQKQDIIANRRKQFHKRTGSSFRQQKNSLSIDSSSPKKTQRSALEMFNDPESIKDINFVKKKANLINHRNQKFQSQSIKEKPFLNTQNLNKDYFLILNEKHLTSERLQNKLINQVSQDNIIVSMLKMENEISNFQQYSVLHKNWVNNQQKQQSIEIDANEQLLEYTRFLMGLIEPSQQIPNQTNIQQQTGKQNENEYLIKFNELVEKQKNKLMVQIANDLNEQIKYINIFRDGHTPGVIERECNNPTFIYFKKCVEYQELSLPIMKYVYKRTLCLQNYRLGIAQVKALSKAWQFFEFKGINRAILDNCDINDNEFSLILKAINKLKDFKQIFYRNNTFSFNSIRQMESIFKKKIPFHLEQLTIENCKIEKEVTRQLLNLLNEKSFIKKLALINIGLEEDSFKQFCQLIKNSLHIIEFDISYSQIRPKNFAYLCEILANNRTLVDINLSNNKLVEFQEKYATEQNFERGDYIKEINLDEIDEVIVEQSQKMVDDLVTFVKKNPNIVHVDLSNTGLIEKHLISFGVALRRTKSLRSIHFSGNQITDNLVDCLVQKSHGIKFQRFHQILFSELPSEINFKQDSLIFKQIQKQFNQDQNLQVDQKLNDFDQNKFLEQFQQKMKDAAQVQFIERHKRMEEKNIKNYEIEKQILVISRLIGHKDDMPGSGRWTFYQQKIKEENDCWICDKQIYTFIFWNSLIGQFNQLQFDQNDSQFIINHIQNTDSQTPLQQEIQLGAKVPVIFGQFTGWKALPMIDVRIFCDRINQKKPNIFEMCKKNNIISEFAESIKDLDTVDKKKYEKEVLFYFNSYQKIWKEIIFKYLKYQEPYLVNTDLESQINDQKGPLYIFPTFVRGGKNLYVIKSESNGQTKYYPGSFIANNREEPVMQYNVVLKRNVITRKFIKEASVFAQWKTDDPLVLKNCLDHDARYWKIHRFVKDPDEYNEVMKVIKRNFEFLKNTHIYLTCKSQFPSIFMNDFTIFSRKAKFLDKNLNQSALDRLFIASNYEVEDQEDNPDTALIRFEFIELLVRIAIEKYKKPGKFNTISQSLECLIQDNIIQVSNHKEWQEFRDKQLYTVEVNDVFEANISNLKKVYNSYLSINQKHLTMDNVIDLFTKKSDCGLNSKDTIFCYGMSKITLANENEKNKNYFKLLFVEFLEMIGRVADLKFKGSEQEDQPLHIKIEYIIDELFIILPGVQRKKIEVFEEEETESNSDY